MSHNDFESAVAAFNRVRCQVARLERELVKASDQFDYVDDRSDDAIIRMASVPPRPFELIKRELAAAEAELETAASRLERARSNAKREILTMKGRQ
jgi:hypothetical protein